ncbi:hypothetical protein CBR_g75717, partial [Chara braunii]
VMPERSAFGGRGYLPRMGQKITIVVGEPIEFDLFHLKKLALSQATGISLDQDQQKLGNSDIPRPKEEQMDQQKESRNNSGSSAGYHGGPAATAGTGPRLWRQQVDSVPSAAETTFPELEAFVSQETSESRSVVAGHDDIPTRTVAGQAIVDPVHRWLYSHITSQIHGALQKLVYEAHSLNAHGSQ